eukprot:TRINITY_DN5436_c0_g1_i1.p2 TRINITY_DN5436_c0_g1~~TRINITY_DN5436_c0_g1_i1.p2  ORF type:complete len:590 (-),score=128.56 TRINITY_DN5436_c0_g1_i1:3851-5620(-)
MVYKSVPHRKTESQTALTIAKDPGALEDEVSGSPNMEVEIQDIPWWNRRTRMERGFCISTSSCFILTSLLVGSLLGVIYYGQDVQSSSAERVSYQTTAAFSVQMPSVVTLNADEGAYITPLNGSQASIKDYCMTKGCITTASEILRNMDETEDPCDDFYRFSCGGFMDKTIIPDDRTRMSSFSVLSDELLAQVRYLLESDSSPNDPRAFLMAKDVYKSCMNKEQIEKLGLDPLTKIIESLGGWPVVEGEHWNKVGRPYIWYEQIFKLRKIGYSVDYLVDFSVAIDLKNSSRRVLDLDQPRFVLDREYLIKGSKDEDVQAYLEFMMDTAVLFGASHERAAIDMREVLEFEMKLANFSLPREKRRNATKLYNPMTIKDLTQLDPYTPWLKYINHILTKELIQVDDSEVIIVNVPSYIKNLSILVKATPKRVQANYMLWRVVSASIKYLNEDAKKISLEFSKKLTGKTEETPRWRTCVDGAKRSLSNAVGAMYVRKYFKEKSRKSAIEMVHDIRKEFNKILKNVDWMDSRTKAMAKRKADSIVEHIGYPPELLDNAKLEELYNGLQVGRLHYLENALNMTVFVSNYAFSLMR